MIKNYFDKQFELRYFEMNEFGVASPTTILTLLEETAADHCYSIDYGLYKLEKENIGWVLVSGIMQIDKYPKYKDKITIRTWISKYSAIKGLRENLIYDEQNNIIGRAKGLWVFFDIGKRMPVRIFNDIKEKWSFCSEESIEHNITKKIEAVNNPDYELKFEAHKYDTDMIKHVNNIRYLQWALESVPDEIIENYYLYSIDGRFTAEAKYGQTIISSTKDETYAQSLDKSFTHSIRIKGTDKICTTAKTVWRKKQ